MPGVVEHEVLVHLVGDHDQVMLDREIGDQLQLVDAQNMTSGIVRAIDQQQLGLGVIAARNSSGSKLYDGGRNVTGLATAPASAMHAW